MSVLVMTVTPANPVHGGVVTVTYSVTGEPSVAPLTLTGSATVDGVQLTATSTTTFSNTEKFDPPVAAGLTFTQSPTDPHVFTAPIP